MGVDSAGGKGMAIDLSTRIKANAGVVRVLNVVAQVPGTASEDVLGITAATGGFQLWLHYTAGAIAVGQSLDVLVDHAPDGVSFFPWFVFATLNNATPPPRVQEIHSIPFFYGSAFVDNAALTVGTNAVPPIGTLRVRGVLTAGAGTPSYTVTLAARGV